MATTKAPLARASLAAAFPDFPKPTTYIRNENLNSSQLYILHIQQRAQMRKYKEIKDDKLILHQPHISSI